VCFTQPFLYHTRSNRPTHTPTLLHTTHIHTHALAHTHTHMHTHKHTHTHTRTHTHTHTLTAEGIGGREGGTWCNGARQEKKRAAVVISLCIMPATPAPCLRGPE